MTKSDRIDARKLAELLRGNQLQPVPITVNIETCAPSLVGEGRIGDNVVEGLKRLAVLELGVCQCVDEEAVDTQVRQKIASQKKEIIEGSEEWDVLYRRYYAEELRRMGIIHQPSA
jgi:hypothetical protein